MIRNRYFTIAIGALTVFCVLGLLVSPRLHLGLDLPVLREDTMFFLQVNVQHYASLDQFMILMTQYGRELVWPITILVLFIFGGITGKKAAIILTLTMIVLIPIGMASKAIVSRPRPFIPDTEFILASDSKHTYPSAHSMLASAGAVIALALLFNNPSLRWKAVSIALAIEAAIVCFSRIYVGAHYLLDVVGGILLGVGISVLFISQTARISNLYTRIARSFKNPHT